MSFKDIIKMNIKPFIFHFCIVVLGTVIIAGYWNTSTTNNAVFVTLLITLFLHYSAGFLLNDYQAWYKNLLSVLFVFLINLIMWFINYSLLFTGSNMDGSLINMIIFIFKLPFLYVLGWDGMNFPLLVSILPALLLFLGLESRVIINSIRNVK